MFLRIEYTAKEELTAGAVSEQTATEQTIVKVPVLIRDGGYVIEDLPVFVNDDSKAAGASPQPIARGPEADKAATDAIEEALTNFYTAYYGEQQSVINYYLSTDADPADFNGLNGRVSFQGIDRGSLLQACPPSSATLLPRLESGLAPQSSAISAKTLKN